jgi:hypothetical protein
MNKILIFAGILLVIGILFISGCAQEAVKTETEEVEPTVEKEVEKEEEETSTKTTEVVKEVTKITKSYCGDGRCRDEENCNSCPEDCGLCELEIFSAECFDTSGKNYNVKLTFKNIETYSLKVTAYPRAVFTDVGIFDGLVKDISVDPQSMKSYLYTFGVGDAIPDEVKITMISDGTKISDEYTVVCTAD